MVLDSDIQDKLSAHREAKKETVKTIVEKQVEQEDIDKLKKLQASMDNLIVSFGQLAIQETAVKAQKAALEKSLVDIKAEELALAKQLSTKYGDGSLDLETGKFTSKS
tara:strand:- start:540 stop:863 length:324 start_codon:yes stop_codon:yes gene_type:complete